MAGLIPSTETCCDPCTSPLSVAVPGPQGDAGENGSNGENGASAYTTTTAQFTMPAEGANVTIAVGESAGFGVGQIVYIQAGGAVGYFEVITKPTATSLEVQNLEDTAAGLYTDNSPPTTVFASSALVSPGGLQGPAGSSSVGAPTDAKYILQEADGDLASAQSLGALATGIVKNTTTAGVGVLSIAAAGTDYYNPGGTDVAVADGGTGASDAATARTNLGLEIGANVQAWDATLDTLASATAFALTLMDDANAATARATLGVQRTLQDYLLFQHRAISGTAGGDFTLGAWRTVPITTEVVDTGNHGSISGNEITLAAGTYRYRYGVVGYQVGTFQGRIYNVDDASVIADTYSQVSRSINTNDISLTANGQGRITLASQKVIRLEAQCTVTNAGDGFGTPGSFGVGEVYSWIEFEKEVG